MNNTLNYYENFKKIIKGTLRLNKNIDNKRRLINADDHDGNEKVEACFSDGMGSATATEIIKRRINKNDIDEYNLMNLENTGRYYIAEIRGYKGNIVQTYMVDKQNGMVRLVG